MTRQRLACLLLATFEFIDAIIYCVRVDRNGLSPFATRARVVPYGLDRSATTDVRWFQQCGSQLDWCKPVAQIFPSLMPARLTLQCRAGKIGDSKLGRSVFAEQDDS